MRKRVLAGLAILFISSSLTITLGVSAHDIDNEQARQSLEGYVKRVIYERRYHINAVENISCRKRYPHQVECTVSYQNAADWMANKTTCSERITVYFRSHGASLRDWNYYSTHQGAHKCGNRYLSGPNP